MRITTWFYRGGPGSGDSPPTGRSRSTSGPARPPGHAGPSHPPASSLSDPNARQWFHPLTPSALPAIPGPLACNRRDDWLAGGALSSAEYAALIRQALSCGQFRADGQQRINGARALRLAGTPRLLRQLRGDEWGHNRPRAVTLWVNATTFLPVRVTVSGWKIPDRKTTDFGWLKLTPANLAMLRVKVPAGLHEVLLPAGSAPMALARP